jgi:hypothetical protein
MSLGSALQQQLRRRCIMDIDGSSYTLDRIVVSLYIVPVAAWRIAILFDHIWVSLLLPSHVHCFVFNLANTKRARKALSRSTSSTKYPPTQTHSGNHLLTHHHSLEMVSSSSDSSTSEDDSLLTEEQRMTRSNGKQKRRKARNQRRYYRR